MTTPIEHVPFVDGDLDESTWVNCSCGWNDLARAKVPWLDHLPDSLDAAWSEAEAALPDGWHICEITRHCHVGDEIPGQWMAEAHDRDRWESELSEADTPSAALRTLAVKLRER